MSTPTPAPRKTKWYKTKWALWAGIFLVGAIFGNATAGGGNSTPTATSVPTATVTVTTPATPVAPATSEATPTTAPPAAPDPAAPAPAAPAPAAPAPAPLSARMQATLTAEAAGGLKPAWMAPITGVEDVSSGTVRVFYQQQLDKTSAQDVGKKVITWTTLSDASVKKDLKVVVMHDNTTDRDYNVFNQNN